MSPPLEREVRDALGEYQLFWFEPPLEAVQPCPQCGQPSIHITAGRRNSGEVDEDGYAIFTYFNARKCAQGHRWET